MDSEATGADDASKAKRSELMLRLNSALVLGTVSLILAYAGPLSFALLISVFVTLMSWEWGRLVRGGLGVDLAFAIQAGGIAAGAIATALQYPASGLFIVIIAMFGVFALRRLSESPEKAWWSAAGVYYAGFPALSLVWLRTDEAYGWYAILFLFVVVWTTDTAAYLFGRAIGGPKLAPAISPKKTWAGFAGGLACAALAGALFGPALSGASAPALAALAAFLALVAQLGDLAESALKRNFGTKDSSSLIPGHGGVLDRVDGLVVAAVAASIIAWAVDPARPGAALLLWR
jgi:phosphatidate cytidylyltransferase